MTPDKLPLDLIKNMWADAERYTEEKVKAINEEHFNVYNAHIAGATAWATWKVKHDELKRVLQEFVSNHEAGLLPNRFVYEKAIKILNDGNTERNAG